MRRSIIDKTLAYGIFLLFTTKVLLSSHTNDYPKVDDLVKVCESIKKGPGLRRYCSNPEREIKYAIKGLHFAKNSCKQIFRNKRFDCDIDRMDIETRTNFLTHSTKESIFFHAITSAGVAWATARECANEFMKECTCSSNTLRNPNSTLAECVDYIAFGLKQSRLFFNAFNLRPFLHSSVKVQKEAKNMVQYGQKLGLRVFKKSLKKVCKCSGVSNSCVEKYCFYQFSSLRNIAEDIYKLYRRSYFNRYGATYDVLSIRKWAMQQPIIFTDKSPSFCQRNSSAGTLGVAGRECDTESVDKENRCNELCCDNGFTTIQKSVEEKCKCEFILCCYTRCDKCNVSKSYNVCNDANNFSMVNEGPNYIIEELV
uniref:Protein Wnt n=1 Tax=Hofstenia miamia TaxID=442651 RepID=A0A068CJX2_HOFMI|nr:wnt-2 [Hofstenia miamia]